MLVHADELTEAAHEVARLSGIAHTVNLANGAGSQHEAGLARSDRVPSKHLRSGRYRLVGTSKNALFRDCGVSAVLESSGITYTLRLCAQCFLALTKQ